MTNSSDRPITYVKRLTGYDTPAPEYAYRADSGFDLRAHLPMPLVLMPGGRASVGTNLAFELPWMHELQVRPRSGMFEKHGVMAMFGTVDNGYRGEIRVLLVNLGTAPYTISNGDKIAQGVLCPVIRTEFKFTPYLVDSDRSEKGFGSTDAVKEG